MSRRAILTHTRHAGKYFDARRLPGGRAYLQVVLSLGDLWKKGYSTIKSDRSDAWYQLVLASPTRVQNLTAKQCNAALKDMGSELVLPSLEYLPAPPKALVNAIADATAITDGDIDGDDAPPIALQDALQSPSSSSPSASASSHEGSGIDGDDDVVIFVPTSISGVRCATERHKGCLDDGLRVWCPLHDNCSKFRSLRRDLVTYGPKASYFYLGAWLAGSQAQGLNHKKWAPSARDIRNFARSHP
jgi:hypothetical protein